MKLGALTYVHGLVDDDRCRAKLLTKTSCMDE